MPVYRVWAASSRYQFWAAARSKAAAARAVALSVPNIATVLECEADASHAVPDNAIVSSDGRRFEVATRPPVSHER
jgi:hypothetical protein